MSDRETAGSRSIRALELLEVVGGMDRAVTAGDIEVAAGLPKATVHRLCNLLLEEGFLRRDLSGRGYELGDRALRLAMKTIAGHGGRGERRAILERVVRDIGETCNITIPTSTGMLYLDRVESEWPLRIQLPTGSTVPLHCTASGKLYLASLAPAARQRLIGRLPLDARATNTITDPKKLIEEIATVAETGIGTDNEELITGMVAVAVPIKDASGRLVATLATHGPVVRMTFERALTHVPLLRTAATALAETLA